MDVGGCAAQTETHNLRRIGQRPRSPFRRSERNSMFNRGHVSGNGIAMRGEGTRLGKVGPSNYIFFDSAMRERMTERRGDDEAQSLFARPLRAAGATIIKRIGRHARRKESIRQRPPWPPRPPRAPRRRVANRGYRPHEYATKLSGKYSAVARSQVVEDQGPESDISPLQIRFSLQFSSLSFPSESGPWFSSYSKIGENSLPLSSCQLLRLSSPLQPSQSIG